MRIADVFVNDVKRCLVGGCAAPVFLYFPRDRASQA